MLTLQDYASSQRKALDEALRDLIGDEEPQALYEPIRYALASQGKRVRGIMVQLAAAGLGSNSGDAKHAAIAVEIFHLFTLVHDDIMDHSNERRGRETIHKRWDEATAILSGDFLMGLSYECLARIRPSRISRALDAYGLMVRRLCEGQALDKAFEAQASVTKEAYLDMIDKKTGALIALSLELGGIVADVPIEVQTRLHAAGLAAGRAFQIQDDLLDATATSAGWGKPVGGDLLEGKKAYLALRALEVEEDGYFERCMKEGGVPPDQLDDAISKLHELGVVEEAGQQVDHYTRSCVETLSPIFSAPEGALLLELIASLATRST
ncbi:MAG: polyprenyl synthetase family protein [Bacteroidetes bacterium]|nr:polyprenyl synthetase family protein [Bacteroidota bacterium]